MTVEVKQPEQPTAGPLPPPPPPPPVVDEKKQREEADKKRKAELDRNLIALNRFMFTSTLFLMFVSNLAIWLYLAH